MDFKFKLGNKMTNEKPKFFKEIWVDEKWNAYNCNIDYLATKFIREDYVIEGTKFMYKCIWAVGLVGASLGFIAGCII